MLKNLPAALLGAALLAMALAAPQPGWAQERPRIGLVLGGGGARGAAHIGVLEVLERLRIPVDCVAGTSMGALVAGAWAAGLSPAQMRERLAEADWNDMFTDSPGFDELEFRTKRLSQRFLPGSETGVTPRGLVGPPGVVSGQKIKLFFNQLVHADIAEPKMEALPLPVSIIATDIASGERVVLREGSLTQAMRASMAVPGLLAPLELNGRKLVDGGLVDNVPVREVRERCGAEVVIAVNVGSPLLKAEDIGGLFSITAQVLGLLTEQNVSASLASLGERDVLIQPDLGTVTAASFGRHAEAAGFGRLAAELQAERLASLSQPAEVYARWQRSIRIASAEPPRIDAIELAETGRVNTGGLYAALQRLLGQPLDARELNRSLLRAYGQGNFERVDYSLVREGDRNVLRVLPVEKGWGPDYLRLGLRLESTLALGATYQLRVGYQKTWLNALGGELLITGDLGSITGLEAEWYQPLDPLQRVFAFFHTGLQRQRLDYFFLDQRLAEYRRGTALLEAGLGLNLPLLGQLRLGWRDARFDNRLETGVDVFSVLPTDRRAQGWQLALDLDRSDSLYFPRKGWEFSASLFLPEDSGYSRVAVSARSAVPLDDWVLIGRVSWVDSPRGRLPLSQAAQLGGFLNLSGYAKGQFLGDGVAYGHLRAERIIGRAPLGLRGDMRLGLALEMGRVAQPYTVQRRSGLLGSVALYVGGETPFGPVYVGLGQGDYRSTNAYLFLGTP